MSTVNVSDFDWKFYCDHYPDLKTAGIYNKMKALSHYIKYGSKENRFPNEATYLAYGRDNDKPYDNILNLLSDTKTGDSKSDSSMIIPSNPSFFDLSIPFCYNWVKKSNLRPTSTILEIGCGGGKLTTTLIESMKFEGQYYGLDLDKKNLDWCRTTFSHASCHFQAFKMESYQEDGLRKTQFMLPYEDHKFDCVWVSTLFTHSTPSDIKHFLAEISRVLKINGKCLMSYYLWNSSLDSYIKLNQSNLKHIQNKGEYWNLQNKLKEQVTVFTESAIIKWLDKVKLPVSKILYGHWSGDLTENAYQDVILAERKK